jgi:hypothetical protein
MCSICSASLFIVKGMDLIASFFSRNHMAMVEWALWGQPWEQVWQVQH